MKKVVANFLLIGIIVFTVQSCSSTEPAKTPIDSTHPDAKVSASVNGKSLYDEKCTMCHGSDGTAGTMGAANLADSRIDHPAVLTAIKNGKNAMKAFSAELNDDQIEALANYVESLRKPD